ncbi:hypothetical protein IAT40_006244 [Kwoniella sp. CBS 6097]
MSASSATTLISPSNARTPSVAGTSTHAMQRRPSTHAHGHVAHGHHTVKRRASSHAHAHGHGHGGGAHGSGRRPSEGDHGRRAMAAGLQMHAMDTTDAVRKQKKKGDRPLPKSSRSDTNLPRLSRTQSMTSNASHSSEASRATTSTTTTGHTSTQTQTQTQNKPRPRRNSHVKSEESVHVLDENGQATEEIDDEEGGGWESGDLEISPEKSKKGKMRDPANATTRSTVSATMRRAASDSTVEPAATSKSGKKKSTNHPSISGLIGDGNLVDTPSNINGPHPPPLTQRTTGFAGGVQPLDPQIAAQLPAADPHPIVTPHPIRRNTSAKSLVGPIAMEPVHSDQGVPTEPPRVNDTSEQEEGGEQKKPPRPTDGTLRHRSTEGSGLPQGREDTSSPSYPFPQMPPPDQQDGKQSDVPTPSAEEVLRHSHRRADSQQQQPSRAATHPPPRSGSQPRSRQTSSQNGPHPPLRHRYSNSSLRSIQSLRAPPHPLNSPTGYRTASSRPGSMFGSPTKGKGSRGERERVHSMHQPPVPAPQVSYEVAQGQGWDLGIPEEDTPRRTINAMGAGPAAGTAKKRQDSVSSTRSIRSILAGTMSNPGAIAPSLSQQSEATASASSRLQSASRQRVHSQQSQGQGAESSQPRLNRRQTAMEAASAASKMATTSDPALYHHSLGHSSNTAESCFLISRFLPFKKIERPKWEMDMRDPSVHEELEAGNLKVGLTNGDYRQAHESLVRSIRQLGLDIDGAAGAGAGAGAGVGGDGGALGAKRGVSRSYSGYNMLTTTNDTSSHINGHGGTDGAGLGTIRGKDGVGMTVSRGAFGGKTPFEMSVQRCLTQRPGGRVGL